MIAQAFSTTLLETSADTARPGARVWAGRVLTGLSALFFLMDGVMKLFKPPVVVAVTVEVKG